VNKKGLVVGSKTGSWEDGVICPLKYSLIYSKRGAIFLAYDRQDVKGKRMHLSEHAKD
jgi:hypothetical protein